MKTRQGMMSAVAAMMLMIGVVFTTSQAQATEIPLTQEWFVTNTNPFDRAELYMLGDAGNAFNPATTSVNGNPDWSFQLVNPDFISMTGLAVTQLDFTTGFADPATEFTLFTVDFAAYYGNVLVEADRLNWNGSWGIFPITGMTGYSRDMYDTSASAPPVPEPGTMVLLGFGLAALAVFNKRRKSALALS